MAHLVVHLATAAALWPVDPMLAAGAMAPDLAWVPCETVIACNRRPARETIDALPNWIIAPYWVTHSLLTWSVVALLSWQLALGAVLHLALDWPTHDGRMRQRPLWPLRARWPRSLIVPRWRE